MPKSLRSRWPVIPTWLKAAPVAGLLLGLSVLSHGAIDERPGLALVVRELFYLPLFMSSLLFGLKGGLVSALIISLNFLPLVFTPHADEEMFMLGAGLQVALYFLGGAITGFLVDRERRDAARVREAEHLAMLGQAAAVVAHELKSPLVAIGGFAKRMQKHTPEDHPNAQMLRIIVDQTAHMERLLMEMLDYSRPLELNLAAVSLTALAEDCLSLLSEQAGQAGVALERNLGSDDGGIRLDEGRIKQALFNLLQNAVQASERGAAVRLTARRQDGLAVLEVRDRGKGIPAEDHDKVFLPFYTTKPRGTGLGLAITRKIVEAHGGGIEMQSRPGEGTSFTLRLPLAGPPEKPPA